MSQFAGLTTAHVVALRLYTTAAFRSINNPLRDLLKDEDGQPVVPPTLRQPHPLPCTVAFLYEALKRTRAAAALKEAGGLEEKSVSPEWIKARKESLDEIPKMDGTRAAAAMKQAGTSMNKLSKTINSMTSFSQKKPPEVTEGSVKVGQVRLPRVIKVMPIAVKPHSSDNIQQPDSSVQPPEADRRFKESSWFNRSFKRKSWSEDKGKGANHKIFWRGMRDLQLTAEFSLNGGTGGSTPKCWAGALVDRLPPQAEARNKLTLLVSCPCSTEITAYPLPLRSSLRPAIDIRCLLFPLIEL